jgi:hypothetical protein
LPRVAKISPRERREWLERYEKGDRIDQIAKDAGRDTRTVTPNIDRARLERDFAAVQRDQLREALQSHQQDMLALLALIGQTVGVPALDFLQWEPDFGLEDLLEERDVARYAQVGVGPFPFSPTYTHERAALAPRSDASYATIIRDSTGPKEVRLAKEDSRLWRALKEHIGARAPLWRQITDWKKALLEECQARATLNRAIWAKAEEVTGVKMLWILQPPAPRLNLAFVWWARNQITKRALGEPLSSLEEEIREDEEGSLQTLDNFILAEGLADTRQARQQLEGVIAEMVAAPETERAVQTYQNLEAKVAEVRETVEEYLLLHYLAGCCSICKSWKANS